MADDARQLTALVCDDDPVVREVVANLLGDLGYQALPVPTAHEVVDLARTTQPALVVLDVAMTGMSGVEALPLVLEASPSTRVVMLTAFDWPIELLIRQGATAVLDKTRLEDVEELARRLRDDES